ncbi:hypothetical protein GCM10009593_18650 [Microlunatus antarcticus]
MGLLSAVPLLLATGAHLVGGGDVLPVGVLLGAAALLLVSTLVSVDRCRFAVLLPLLAAEQVLLHLLFSAADTAAMCLPSAAAAGAHAGHAAHGAAATLDPGSAAGLQACAESHAMGASWLMVGAHAAATLAVAWLLARGEAWWWRTVATLVLLVAARPTRRRPRALAVLARPVLLAGRLVLDAASPRGPPLCS